MTLLYLILKSIYFMAPVYFANMTPVFLAKIPGFKKWNMPMDFGKKIGRKRIFGSHKTWRGFIGGIVAAMLVAVIQRELLYNSDGFIRSISIVAYHEINIFLFAFLFGFGAMLGDAVKSFFKRRIGKNSGESWPVFDQLDYVVGSLIFISPLFFPSWDIVLTVVIVTPALNILANVIGYVLKLKKVWW